VTRILSLSLVGRGRWPIGLRVAVTFALVTAGLCALVLAGVAWATTQGVAGSVAVVEDQVLSGAVFEATSPDAGADAEADGVRGAGGTAAPAAGDEFEPVGPSSCEGTPCRPAPAGVAAVSVIRDVTDVARRQQVLWSVVGTGVAALAAGGVGLLLSRRMLGPLDEVVATTRRVTATTLHERIALAGPRDEIARVADTIDDLLDRLEASFEAQRRFVAYASHELRTPLAVQRAALQIGLDDPDTADVAAVRDQLLEVNRRSEHLVESLLALATADRGLAAAGSAVDLGEVTGRVATGLADAARASLVHVRVEVGAGTTVEADEVLLQQLVRNLVANAVEYNEPGGWVRVSAEPDAVLVVENTGRRVSDETAATLTRPFVRADGDDRRCVSAPAAPHSGLGLAIVASIARAHGWALEVRPRESGGLRVVVR
jgi:signal transduction histidine kinase